MQKNYCMDMLILIFQLITLIIVTFLLINSLLKDDKEPIKNYLKEYFNRLQDSINRINQNLLVDVPKIRAATTYISGLMDKMDFQLSTFNPLTSASFSPINLNQIINLTDFEIYYFTPYEGYLSIDVDYCEIRFLDDSQLIIKNHLKNFFLEAKKTISIRNIKNLKNIRYEKKK